MVWGGRGGIFLRLPREPWGHPLSETYFENISYFSYYYFLPAPPAYQRCSLKYQGWAVTNLNRRGSWWNVPHPRKMIKNAVNASRLCMCALRIDAIMPPPSPSPLPTLPHPSPPPGIPTHYESTKPFGIPRKPVFPKFLRGFNMRNLANIVGRGGRLLLLLLVLLLRLLPSPLAPAT